MRNPLLKKMLIAIAAIIIAAAALFFYRYEILQYSAEKIVRRLLPEYVVIEKMRFNFRDSKIVFNGFKILNPPNFSDKYLLEIGEIECSYRVKGRNVLDGVEILSPIFREPALFIERLGDARTNLQEMTGFMKKLDSARAEARTDEKGGAGGDGKRGGERAAVENANLPNIVKLPEEFIVEGGKVIFLDGMVRPGTYKVTLDGINAMLRIVLDDTYTKALGIATTGSGAVNGRPGETIMWDTKLDPTASHLTMSNRFSVKNVDITAFSPYYYRYSPLIFRRGYFSGQLVFDFDNGNIGSANEVILSQLSFNVKRGFEGARYFDTSVPDLIKYFTSSRGDVIFDFKIKGPMSDPKFYLGPISKQAIASLAIGKVVQALSDASGGTGAQDLIGTGAGKSVGKAADYIKIFKGLLKDRR